MNGVEKFDVQPTIWSGDETGISALKYDSNNNVFFIEYKKEGTYYRISSKNPDEIVTKAKEVVEAPANSASGTSGATGPESVSAPKPALEPAPAAPKPALEPAPAALEPAPANSASGPAPAALEPAPANSASGPAPAALEPAPATLETAPEPVSVPSATLELSNPKVTGLSNTAPKPESIGKKRANHARLIRNSLSPRKTRRARKGRKSRKN